MRKLAITIALLLAITIVSAVPTLSNPTPPSGSTITGNASTTFNIEGNQTLMNGILLWNGVYKPSLLQTGNLNCSGSQCSAPYDMSAETEVTHFFQFSADGANSATYTITINRPPMQPTNCAAMGYNETALELSCDPGETDISHYMVYRNNDAGVDTGNSSQFVTNTTLPYIDGFLTTLEDYYYKVIAVDTIGQVSPSSTEFSGVVLDTTPPSVPLFIPSSPANFSNNTFQLNITYQENVSLYIYSGPTLVDSFQCVFSCLWNKTLANGTYLFDFEAYDASENMRTDPWQVAINQIENLTLNVTMLQSVAYTRSVIKGSVLPGDYFLVNYTWSMFPFNCLNVRLTDIVGSSTTIDVTTDSQPTMFCAADYNPVTRDVVGSPTYAVVNLTNANSTQNVQCPDSSTTMDTAYSTLLKIPVPLSALADQYTFTFSYDAQNC